MSSIKKLYELIKGCKTQIKGFDKRGFTDCTFSALLYFGKKQLNGIEHAGIENFSELLRDYFKTEHPDRIKLEFYGCGTDSNKRMLYSKTYEFAETQERTDIPGHMEQPAPNNLFAGLGEAQVNEW